jgi:hypothetical protein
VIEIPLRITDLIDRHFIGSLFKEANGALKMTRIEKVDYPHSIREIVIAAVLLSRHRRSDRHRS